MLHEEGPFLCARFARGIRALAIFLATKIIAKEFLDKK